MDAPRKIVGIVSSPGLAMFRGIILALAELFPVEFRDHPGDTFDSLDAIILLQASRDAGLRAAGAGVRCLAFLDGTSGDQRHRLDSLDFHFGSSSNLHPCLRNQVLTQREAYPACPLQPEPGDVLVASCGTQPAWLYRVVGMSAVDFVSRGPLPPVPHNLARWHLCGCRFMPLLPLLNFLHGLTSPGNWSSGPLRACLVLDDPNLYHPSYGCLNFSQLAAHALTHRYHAAVAMVPLDAWHVCKTAGSVFRDNSTSLSLLIHGNNHTDLELARPCSASSRLATLAQALKRVERLEQRNRLRVARVMAAPHGAYSSETFPLLAALGYEAALVTTELLVLHNPKGEWHPALGLDLAAILPGGFSGIPRIILAENWKTEVVLAAFLGQSIVVAGHHHDADGDMHFFAEIAATINRLGDVQWTDVQSLSRTNYKTRRTGDRLSIRLYSRRATVRIPDGVREVTINRPWLSEGTETLVIGSPSDSGGRFWLAGAVSDPVPVKSPSILEVNSTSPNSVDYHSIPSPQINLWPVMRKVGVEVRDRAYPILHRRRGNRLNVVAGK